MLKDFFKGLQEGKMPIRKTLEKKGTLAIGVVEGTPVIWKGHLIRIETIHSGLHSLVEYPNVKERYFHFVDMETGEKTSGFAYGYSYGVCYTENNKMYVFGETEDYNDGKNIDMFVSEDLVHWEKYPILAAPAEGIRFYNTSVCKGNDRYIMAIEIGGPHPAVGCPFTIIFAESKDLMHWEFLPIEEYSHDRGRYTACPVIRYYDGYYYMICLESAPGYRWFPYIVRSEDLKEFEFGLTNPIMFPSNEDKNVIRPERYSEAQLEYIATSADTNNSDVDMCEYNGKTVILYTWGNQMNKQNLALAEYDGSEEEFLKSFFE